MENLEGRLEEALEEEGVELVITPDTIEDFINKAPVDILPKEFKAQWIEQLDEISDDQESLRDFQVALNEFLSKRKGLVIPDPELSSYAEHHGEVLSGVQEYIEKLRGYSTDPKQTIGQGRYGRVSQDANNPAVCMKRIHNFVEYAKQDNQSVRDEMGFLDRLAEESVDGVHAPHPYAFIDGINFKAIIMERINGWSIADFKAGDVIIPDAEHFDVETFVGRLARFVKRMHEKGIYHRDLFSRNVMMDPDHTPYIIDFGNAIFIDPEDRSEDAREKREGYTRVDFSRLTRVREDLEEILRKYRRASSEG